MQGCMALLCNIHPFKYLLRFEHTEMYHTLLTAYQIPECEMLSISYISKSAL